MLIWTGYSLGYLIEGKIQCNSSNVPEIERKPWTRGGKKISHSHSSSYRSVLGSGKSAKAWELAKNGKLYGQAL